jgi:hypothetical protein
MVPVQPDPDPGALTLPRTTGLPTSTSGSSGCSHKTTPAWIQPIHVLPCAEPLLDQMKNSCDHPSYALIDATTDGTRTSGQPCAAVDQCAGTPALCLMTGTTGSGTCMTPPRGKPGDDCAVTCDDTTVCKWPWTTLNAEPTQNAQVEPAWRSHNWVKTAAAVNVAIGTSSASPAAVAPTTRARRCRWHGAEAVALSTVQCLQQPGDDRPVKIGNATRPWEQARQQCANGPGGPGQSSGHTC